MQIEKWRDVISSFLVLSAFLRRKFLDFVAQRAVQQPSVVILTKLIDASKTVKCLWPLYNIFSIVIIKFALFTLGYSFSIQPGLFNFLPSSRT